MEEKAARQNTSSEDVGCTDASDDAIEDHPLFMTRIPAASDFKNNSMLAALAALIDEEEEEPQDLGPVRRQRRPARPQPWTPAKCFNQRLRKSSPQGTFHQKAPYQASRGAAVGGSQAEAPAELSRRGEATDEVCAQEVPSLSEEMDCEAGQTQGSTATAHEAQRNSPSLGELQICMRLFSMKPTSSGFLMPLD
ncbi:hypothetical protein Esti_001463 [Eimeria stiedai]